MRDTDVCSKLLWDTVVVVFKLLLSSDTDVLCSFLNVTEHQVSNVKELLEVSSYLCGGRRPDLTQFCRVPYPYKSSCQSCKVPGKSWSFALTKGEKSCL